MNELEFLKKLKNGGAIVCSGECSEIEIVDARLTDRFFVDEDGFGYVLRYPVWLKSREDAYFCLNEIQDNAALESLQEDVTLGSWGDSEAAAFMGED